MFGSVRVAEVGGYLARQEPQAAGLDPAWCTRILSLHPDGNPVTAAELALGFRPTPILSAAPNGAVLDRGRLLSALRDRKPPTAEQLAEFVVFRTGCMADAGLLHEVGAR
jgi:hypothetical protein